MLLFDNIETLILESRTLKRDLKVIKDNIAISF